MLLSRAFTTTIEVLNGQSGDISQPDHPPSKGAGVQKGLGEKFSPDLHTGTDNFTIPIATSPGRNDFEPQLTFDITNTKRRPIRIETR